MKKKVLSLLLTLCLVMTFVPMAAFAEDAQNISVWDGSTAAAFAGGTGTAEDPYQIANGAELAYLASSVNNGETYEAKNFVLTANIDLNGLPWTPIANSFSDALFGGSDYRVFAGNFDGKGYTISNVSIGSETTPLESDVLGLFGATEGKISNLNLDTVSIHGVAKIASGYVIGIAGGLVGSSAGSIENCHVTGLAMDMSAPSNGYVAAYWVGGLVGALDGAQLINECSVSGSITEKAGKGSIGGLIGELGKAAKITYSRSDVTVNVKADSRGGANVGGFIGKGNGKTDAETIIRNCYATGNVTGGAYTGGFAGGLWGLNIKNCYASGNVSQAAAAMASFVGTDASDPNYYGSITNCFATGSVTGSSPFQYAFAEQSSATKRSEITNCYFAEENSGIKTQYESATAKSQDEMKTEAFAADLNNGDNSNGWSFVNGQVLGGAEPADYSAVEAAMAAIPTDLTVYTDESVAALNTAVDGVVRGKALASQANALLFAFCGICALMGVSSLLGCMSMSMIYINTSDDERLFKQLNYFSPPLLLLFFVRSGLNFDLGAIFSSSDHIGSASLLAVGVVYFVTRILGKYIGAFLGCLLAGKNKKVRNNLGLALIPQAGVAIGLAAMGARTLGGAMGDALETIILASSVLYELIGPACAKLSLYLSGSYSNRLDDIVTETVKCDGHEPENEVERLIRQIQAIQKELPAHNDPFLEDEQAYDEAAYEHYALTGYPQVSYQNTRRKADIWTL